MLPQFWFFYSIFEALASVERLSSPVDALNKLDKFYVLLAELFNIDRRKLNIEAQSQKNKWYF